MGGTKLFRREDDTALLCKLREQGWLCKAAHRIFAHCMGPAQCLEELAGVCWVQADLQILPFDVNFFLFVSERLRTEYVGRT